MSNYAGSGTRFTNVRGNPADPAIFDAEFTKVATASATKIDKDTNGTITGNLTVSGTLRGGSVTSDASVTCTSLNAGTGGVSGGSLNVGTGAITGGTASVSKVISTGDVKGTTGTFSLGVTGATITGGGAGTTGSQLIRSSEVYKRLFVADQATLLFYNNTAPIGWIRLPVSSIANGYAITIKQSGNMSSGGTAGQDLEVGLANTGSHVLTKAEIPLHTHGMGRVIGGTGSLQFIGGTGVADLNPATTGDGAGKGLQGLGHSHSVNWKPKWINMTLCKFTG